MTNIFLHPGAQRGKTFLAATVLTIALSGCITTSGEVKTNTAALDATLLVRGKLEPGASYTVYSFTDPVNCRGLQALGSGSTDQPPEKISIASNQRTSLSILFQKPGNRYCFIRPSFLAKSGQRYLLSVNSQPGSCYALISNASDADHIVPEPSTIFKDAHCNIMSGDKRESANDSGPQPDFPSKTKDGSPQLFSKPFDDELKGLIQKDKK